MSHIEAASVGGLFRKCKTFYLAAANEAKIPVSPYILKNKKPRSAPTRRRSTRPNGGRTNATDNETRESRDPPPTGSISKPLSQQLLEELNPNKMTAEETQAVWTLLVYLRKEGK